MEIAASDVAAARARTPEADLRHYDGARLPWEDGTWDVGVVSHVLEHVYDPVSPLREAARVCGTVVLEIPLEANVSARRAAKRHHAEEIGHLHAFSRTSARGLVVRAGLELLGELTDPLGRDVHRWTSGPGRGDAKWLVRAALHAASPALAARLFTLHWTAACRR